jgi:hypothetical protein
MDGPKVENLKIIIFSRISLNDMVPQFLNFLKKFLNFLIKQSTLFIMTKNVPYDKLLSHNFTTGFLSCHSFLQRLAPFLSLMTFVD